MANTSTHLATTNITEALELSRRRVLRTITEELISIASGIRPEQMSERDMDQLLGYAGSLSKAARKIITLTEVETEKDGALLLSVTEPAGDEVADTPEDEVLDETLPMPVETAAEQLEEVELPQSAEIDLPELTDDIAQLEILGRKVTATRPKGTYVSTWRTIVWILEASGIEPDVEFRPSQILDIPGSDEIFGDDTQKFSRLTRALDQLGAVWNGQRARGSRYVLPASVIDAYCGEPAETPQEEKEEVSAPEPIQEEKEESIDLPKDSILLTDWGLRLGAKHNPKGSFRMLYLHDEKLSNDPHEREKIAAMLLSLIASTDPDTRVVDVDEVLRRLGILTQNKIKYTFGHVRLAMTHLMKNLNMKHQLGELFEILEDDDERVLLDENVSTQLSEEVLLGLGYDEDKVRAFLAR